MEASSPLAALHRPMMLSPAWGGRDMLRSGSLPHYAGSSSVSGSLSLREQLHKSSSDYLSVKEVRGSSPAASLAADLSQNFRLDNEASPQFPTPRRALFTANMMSGMEGRHFVTTPPLPSSPSSTTELMEVSPLPHKTPFSNQIEITSPTPISTPTVDEDHDDDMVLDSPAPITRQGSAELPKPILVESVLLKHSCRLHGKHTDDDPKSRKKAALRRPSLSRMKGLTTTAVPSRVHAEHQLPSFRFGPDCAPSYSSSSLSPGQCFDTASSPQERRPQSANSPCSSLTMTARSRPLLANMAASASHRHALPPNGHSRRQSNPFLRNRKQFRRSLSIFEHPADVIKPQSEGEEADSSSLKSVMDIEEMYEPRLPHFLPDDPTDTIPRISNETLLKVLDGKYADKFDQKVVIDCRFEYEYEGGHIEGAVNHNDKELLASQLFQTPMPGATLFIFHCEYSAHRAPLMARHIRSEDRTANAEQYPHLTYPEVYILDRGYNGFFSEHRDRCFPPEYVEMSDEKHQRTCEREMGRLKARKGLGRAQTFAFGQCGSSINHSPTAPSRLSSRLTTMSSLGPSPFPCERSPASRMASY